MKFLAKVLISLIALTFLFGGVSAEEDFIMEEDSAFQTEETIYDLLDITGDMFLGLDSDQENITVSLVDGYLNITSTGNWYGIALIGYNYVENGTLVDGAWALNVTPVNDAPEILDISLSGDPENLANPVTCSVSYLDVDGDDIMVSWFLDEETAGEGETITRYIFPDQNNLTVVIDDGNGGTDSLSTTIHTIPPEGWGDEPDNTRNRIIFWIIFGSAGLILIAAAAWVILAPSKPKREGDSPDDRAS
ncbi:MAG: hypothetical protein ACMUHM_08050 [Thermoplasmatota archaeon]